MNDPLPSSLHALTATALLSAYRRGELSPVEVVTAVLERIAAQAEAGHAVPAVAFQAALMTRREVGVRMQTLLREYDLLAMPTHHIPPPPVPGYPPGMEGAPFPFTAWVNHTTQPAASVPCGLTAAGLPVGLQLIGARYADALVLRAARAYESARGPFPEAPLARGPA